MYNRQMFVHQMCRADVDFESVSQFNSRLNGLPQGFNRILLPTREFTAELLSISAADVLTLPFDQIRPLRSPEYLIQAEVIASPTNVFVITVNGRRRPATGRELPSTAGRTPEQYVFTVHSVGPHVHSQRFDELKEFLNNAFSFELEDFRYRSYRLDELKAEGRTPPSVPSESDLAAAEVLSDRLTRHLAIAIKQSSGLLVGDLQKQLPSREHAKTPQIRAALEGAKLVETETVVICTKTGAQMVKGSDASVVEKAAAQGLKCACGNPITAEKVEQALSISDYGRTLIDGSRWFTVLLIHNLMELGVPLDRILIDQVSGGDEMDCIADIGGDIVLFELKDKEFSLGNAYSFGAKIGIIEPGYPVIVTTEKVGNDAKDHFAKTQHGGRRGRYVEDVDGEHSVTYIEGIDNLNPALQSLISKINIIDFRRVLDDVLLRAAIWSSAVISSLEDRFKNVDPHSEESVKTPDKIVRPRSSTTRIPSNPKSES